MEVLSRAPAASAYVSVGRTARPPARLPLASIFGSTCSFLASSVPGALALNYEDLVKGTNALPDALNAADSFFIDFDAATDFMTANPVAFLAGLTAVAGPLIAFTALAIPRTYGFVSAAEGFENLAQPNAQLLDIRADGKAEGSPNLKSLGKKVVQRAYSKGDDTEAFLSKVLVKFKDPASTTLYILDRLDGNSLEVAKLLANNGFEGAFAIKGGAEGPNGWKKKGLPWLAPDKGFGFNPDGLKDILSGTDTANLVPVTLGLAAAAGIGVAVFTEAESVLQLLGSAALIQIFVRKLMFAKDREKTIKDVATFLNTKVAPEDFADELKEVGRVLLVRDVEIIAPVESGEALLEENLNEDNVTQDTSPKVAPEVTLEVAPEVTSEVAPEVTSEVAPEVTSEVAPEVTSELAPKITSELAPKVTSEVAPEVTSEVAPEVTSEVAPEVTSEVAPEVTSEVAPEVTSEVAPEVTSEVAPEVTPSIRPRS